MGILTIGIVTKPFRFEGKQRMANALSGIERLTASVDTLIVIPNDKLLQIVDRRTNIEDAMSKADEVLQQAVSGITDLINVPGLINLDFADVQTVMLDKGVAHVGIGRATGDDKAIEAVKQAVSSPLLETNIKGASNVIVNISGDISLIEADEAMTYIQELTGEDANVIFGVINDETNPDEVSITVIATGLDAHGLNTPLRSVMKESAKKPSLGTNSNISRVVTTNQSSLDEGDNNRTARSERVAEVAKEEVKEENEPTYRPRQRAASITIPDFLQRK